LTKNVKCGVVVFLLFERVLNTADAPEAIDTENDDVDKDAAEASERIDEHVAGACVATNDSELMNLIEGAVNRREDDRIKDLSISWEANWVETLDETSATVAEGAKEEEMGELASDFVGEAEERGETGGFCIGDVAVVGRKRPNQNNEE
jgi:hypothetical protein